MANILVTLVCTLVRVKGYWRGNIWMSTVGTPGLAIFESLLS